MMQGLHTCERNFSSSVEESKMIGLPFQTLIPGQYSSSSQDFILLVLHAALLGLKKYKNKKTSYPYYIN